MLHRLLWKIRRVLSGIKEEPVASAATSVEPAGPTQPGATVANDEYSAGLPDFQFEAEMPAEAFFLETRGDPITGSFNPVGEGVISFIDAEWDIDDLDKQTISNHSTGPGAASISLSDLRSSVKRIRSQAERHRLLSPKSSLALAKLETGKAKLTESDLNALQYLLSRLGDSEKTASDVAFVADYLLGL
ncbi:hypothetical protein [Ensifer adhaerens]|uniref:hypothetical protein n=1 Tax=Ensifer adhaerens TaxID=106592 RepID=UPI00132F3B30|nr:hypothetical protein [Ensifer adhaerens]QHG71504.1 hypothetical protein DQW09_17365 [Ensifer adhaerens]